MADLKGSSPNNLPHQVTSFVGREREIVKIERLLARTRLVTLTGAGGCGKTRLAQEVGAGLLDRFSDGVWWVEMAALSEPELVPQAVTAALDVHEQPGRPLVETLGDYLRPKSLLLLLDNCEHLHSACARLVDTLLSSCTSLRILATSRESLGLPGETKWRVPSLSLPERHLLSSVKHLARYEAVRLFCDRARAAEKTFALSNQNALAVAQVCTRLDGIPLAIELAAARVAVLAVDQIAARLDDPFRLLTGGSQRVLPRQQTLRATMDWSYDLLSEPERTLLRRLSVFAGGWTLEAAEAICSGEGVEASDVLDLLTQLVDKSVVVAETRKGEARCRLLETVRQYGLDRLSEAGETEDVERRHRDWYLQLAVQAFAETLREVSGQRQALWFARLETEHDNFRAALARSKAQKDGAEAGVRLAGALQSFWFSRGHWREGRGWLEGALARSAEAPPSALPNALYAAADFAWRLGDYGQATTLGEKAVALCRELGDKEGTASSLGLLGVVAIHQGDYERATALCEETLDLSRETGNKPLIGMQLAHLGIVARNQGCYERAIALHSDSLALFRELGDKWNIAFALRNLGDVAFRQSDYRQAEASFTEGLILCKEVGDRWISNECLERVARVACAKALYEQAARLFGAAEMERETLGHSPDRVDRLYHDNCVASAHTALGDAAFAAAWAHGRAMTLEQAMAYALAPGSPSLNIAGSEKAALGKHLGHLTLREEEIAGLIAKGLTNRRIAAKLAIAKRTADTHVQHILNKLGINSRAEIAAWAVEHGLHRSILDETK